MTQESWRPFGYNEESDVNYDILIDNVPHWMEKSLFAWLEHMLCNVLMDEQPGIDVVHKVERAMRVQISLMLDKSKLGLSRAVIEKFRYQELVLTDYLLSTVPIRELGGVEEVKSIIQKGVGVLGQLEVLLREAGSKWQVGIRTANALGLVQRVPEGVQNAVEQTIQSSGQAGARLASAWAAAFGIAPNPSHAYSLAVKAVEDAAVPVICPKDSTATLGKINSQMRNTGNWSLPLAREDEHATASATMLSMMKMLWAGQADRHGGNPDPSLVITQEAAEVAVMTAATLVQWFTSGAVARRA
ncbi:hypothetical protein M1D88_12595 [Arthrobacter sp. R1-13]